MRFEGTAVCARDARGAALAAAPAAGAAGGGIHWGDPRLKSSALQAQILKSLKSMPRHTFKAPDTNILKSDKSLRAADEGDGCLA